MTRTDITEYRERPGRIAAWDQRHEVAAPVQHPAWSTFGPAGSTRAIAASPAGEHVWLGTWGGVVMWSSRDPDIYTVHRSEHGLAGNAVSSLCADGSDGAWAGHPEGGLSRYRDDAWRPCDALRDVPLRAVASAADGVWAAGERTVYRVDAAGAEVDIVTAHHEGAANVHALLDDGDAVLAGSESGLYRLTVAAPPARIAGILGCVALARDSSGAVWAAGPTGVLRLEGDRPTGTYGPSDDEPEQRVLALACSGADVWVLTTAGVAVVGDDEWRPLRWDSTFGEPPVLRALAAGRDTAWLGTERGLAAVTVVGGRPRWQPNLVTPATTLPALGRCACRTAAGMMVGTATGLAREVASGEWTLDRQAGDVRALVAGRDGVSWLLSWPAGVARVDGHGRMSFRVPQPPGIPVALAWGDGAPHVLAGRRLHRIGTHETRGVGGPLPHAAHTLAITADGTWWAGSRRGVLRLGAENWAVAGEAPGPLDAEVRALVAVGDAMWAATAAGLWQWRERRWTRHESAERAAVRIVAPGDDGRLWVADEEGVSEYDPREGRIVRRFTRFDSGLASSRVEALLVDSGTLWIVTAAGTVRVEL